MVRTQRHITWVFIGLVALSMVSCKVKRPDTVLSDKKMEAVLYDYHIAKAMGEQIPYNENYKRVLYMEAVYKKHGITEAQFDSSMVWFSRNPEVLRNIYEKVNERLKTEKGKIDALIAKRDNKPTTSQQGDSIDVWAWQRTLQLTGMPLGDKFVFSLPSDENFEPRDTLRWNVRVAFHGKMAANDSVRFPAIMAMQVFYDKDTVINALRQIERPGMESVSLWADTLGKIEKVYGFIYYPSQESDTKLLIDQVSLMRYHAKDSLSVADTVSLAKSPVQKSQASKSVKLKVAD